MRIDFESNETWVWMWVVFLEKCTDDGQYVSVACFFLGEMTDGFIENLLKHGVINFLEKLFNSCN